VSRTVGGKSGRRNAGVATSSYAELVTFGVLHDDVPEDVAVLFLADHRRHRCDQLRHFLLYQSGRFEHVPRSVPLVARFGGIPLKRQKKAVLVDREPARTTGRRKGSPLLRNVSCLRSDVGAALWSKQALPCRICRKATQTRDDRTRPCHKTCAEDEIWKA
jgi:hypothetical protein